MEVPLTKTTNSFYNLSYCTHFTSHAVTRSIELIECAEVCRVQRRTFAVSDVWGDKRLFPNSGQEDLEINIKSALRYIDRYLSMDKTFNCRTKEPP